jgi:hypothetical protein
MSLSMTSRAPTNSRRGHGAGLQLLQHDLIPPSYLPTPCAIAHRSGGFCFFDEIRYPLADFGKGRIDFGGLLEVPA